jgi:hypothetical protein
MKKLLAILPLIIAAGCATTAVPVARHFPDVPKELLEQCPSLKTVPEGTTKLSEVLTVVTDNYSTYHECRVKESSWIEWYKAQKSIFEEVK